MTSIEPPACANCGTPLAGHYCHHCGQQAEQRFDSMRQFVRASFGDLLHLDSRTARTVAHLLTRPGRLTREFLDGRRIRYTQPFQLYVLAAAVFFLANSFWPFVQVDLERREIRSSLSIASAGGAIEEDDVARLAARGISLELFSERFQSDVQKNLPTFMIGSIILFALALAAFHLFSNRNLFAHLVFSLHWCAFYLLLMVFDRLVSRGAGPNAFGAILAAVALVYLTMALRRVHGQSWWITIPKGAVLFVVFNAVLALWVSSVMLYAYRTV